MDIYANILSWQWIITAIIIVFSLLLIYRMLLFKTKLGERTDELRGSIVGFSIALTSIILSSLIN